MFAVRHRSGTLIETVHERDLDCYDVYALTPGPTSYITAGFDHHLLRAAPSLTGVKWVFGCSTGALRAIAIVNSLVTGRPVINELLQKYGRVNYRPWYSSETMSLQMVRLSMAAVSPDEVSGVLGHASMRVLIPVTASHIGVLCALGQTIGLCCIGALSLMGKQPNVLYFYSGNERPNFIDAAIQCIRLTEDNIYHVLRATTAVPVVTTPIMRIPGAQDAWFMDGGVGCTMLPPSILADGTSMLVVSSRGDAMHTTTIFSKPMLNDDITVLHLRDERHNIPRPTDFLNPWYIRVFDKRVERWREEVTNATVQWPERIADLQETEK
jgi:hypothetical protein